MLNSILPQSPPPVNTPLIRRDGRSYYQSVVRACGHDELVPAADGRDGAAEWAQRADIDCHACRMARHQAQISAAPNLLSRPTRRSASHAGGGNGATRTPTPRRPRARRPRKTAQELIALRDTLELYNEFLDLVTAGALDVMAETVNSVIRKRDALQRQLRAYGVA